MLRSGSRGEPVSELQRKLEAAGFSPGKIDGIFGPKTEAALREYQKANGLSADGIYGPKTAASFDDPNTDSGGTAESGEGGPRFSLGGDPSLWKVGDKVYVVHETTATDGSRIRMAWLADPSHVEGFFGPGQDITYDQTMDALPGDVLFFGASTELLNMTDDPITIWRNTLEREALTQPWLLDIDYQTLSLMALLEGRTLSDSEIFGTKWYSENNSRQRKWMLTFHSDPMSADSAIQSGRISARQLLQAMGMNNATDDLVNFIADKFTMGDWNQTYYQSQLTALTDPQSGIAIDSELLQMTDSFDMDTTQGKEGDVRSLVKQWLGPNFGNWDEDVIAQWAGKLRNDPDAVLHLTETLKDQRSALFPEYDRESTYDTIASPWRQYVRNLWGESPDEADPLFHSIINMNNAGEAGKLLTREGLNRSNQTVENRVHSEMVSSFGGTAR